MTPSGGWLLAVALLGLVISGCGEDGAARARTENDADGSGQGGTEVEMLRAHGEDLDRSVVAHTAEAGTWICIDVTQRRGVGGGCGPVPEAAMFVNSEATGGLVYGFLTGHPEVVEVRVDGGGRELILPLRDETALRPSPIHQYSGEPIRMRFFAAADPVAYNDYTVTPLDADGRPVEVEIVMGDS